MISINKPITISRFVTETIIATSKDFTKVVKDKEKQVIEVEIRYIDVNGNEISRESYRIVGELYDLVMSQSPDFAEGKPADDFRDNDLWYIIDKIEEDKDTIVQYPLPLLIK
ncbi:hypothetical protein P4571_07640 [Niallia alba]|uniref:hypothetical protein n=1 Tax=Niallia alba TaxID=2729105 RepID=UPI002E1BF6C2|nr:hypothetical protein [Niallia alba]